jgi:hypothetical protein
MGHLLLGYLPFKNLSASKVVGIRKDPAGRKPVERPWGRFRFYSEPAIENLMKREGR